MKFRVNKTIRVGGVYNVFFDSRKYTNDGYTLISNGVYKGKVKVLKLWGDFGREKKEMWYSCELLDESPLMKPPFYENNHCFSKSSFIFN
jgi:hypothetical protein